MTIYQHRIDQAAELLRSVQRIVAFSGAGISTESGLSDFRSPGGVWDRHRIVTYQEFLTDAMARKEYWGMKLEFLRELDRASPNRAHEALARLERLGKLDRVITQNIDGFHQDAGSSRVIELHGTNRKAVCVSCGREEPIAEVRRAVEAGNWEPRCADCRGLVKPATISFGQAMPAQELEAAFAAAAACDLLLMIGSSLQVEPAASIPREAKRSGAVLIFINRTETPWDTLATVLFREPAGTVLSDLADQLDRQP
jgi:NAD-dependent deacetylase